MPNFAQIQDFRNRYSNNLRKSEIGLSDVDNVVKYFSDTKLLNESLLRSPNPYIYEYLEKQKEAHLVTLFIDICSFSTKVKGLSNEKLSIFLDNYYDAVIPIIYEHGGEVEKIIGDGIIAIFGQPFLADSIDSLLDKADKCAKAILRKLENTLSEVKVALHDGVIKYYKNKTSKQPEYTIIGSVLTGLFRLESIAIDNTLNYYCGSSYDGKFWNDKVFTGVYIWQRSRQIEVNLKGVDFKYVRNFRRELAEASTESYDIKSRIKTINQLSTRNYAQLEPQSELPKLKEESTIFRGAILSVSLNNDFKQPQEMKALQLIFSEIVELLNSSTDCLKIEVHNYTIQAIYKGYYQFNLVDLPRDAMRITALAKTLSHRFESSEKVSLRACLKI